MGWTTAAGRRSSRVRLGLLGFTLAALLAALLGAPAANAGLDKEFAVFNHCPVNNPEVTVCVYSTTTSGEFKLGSNTVPINKTVVLQGGLTEGGKFLVPPEGAEELSKTPLELPGGLTGITLLGNLNEVYAVAEPTGPIEINVPAFGKREGAAVVLPFKTKLENPSLGEECYVGTDAEPAVLHLTTGTTSPPSGVEPITGSGGTLEIVGAGKINVFRENTLVDNTFPAPGAHGCGGKTLEAVVDPSVDLKAGLPAEAGKNVAKMTGTLEQTTPRAFLKQMALPEIGRCVLASSEKVGKERIYHGGYVNSGCTYESGLKIGKYEWVPGPGPNAGFTGSGKLATLSTVGGAKVTCLNSTSSGEYTGTKTATVSLTLTGCTKPGGAACQSSGASAGEIRSAPLSASLGFIQDTSILGVLTDIVGLDLTNGTALIAAECGGSGEALTVTGSVIGQVGTVNKPSLANSVKYKALAGKQTPEAFEEEPADVLSATFGGGSPEQAGLTSTEKFANAEKTEIKAAAE